MMQLLLYLLLILIIGFAILRKPLWGLFIAVISELWLANYFLFGNYYLRLRIVILPYLLIVLYIWHVHTGHRLKMNRTVLTFLGIQTIMVMITILVNLAHSIPIEIAAVQIARVGVSIVITIILYMLIDNEMKLRRYLLVIGGALAVSASVGILQAIFGDPFYDFKAFLIGHAGLAKIDIRGEASGLALYSLMLAYQIVCVLPILLSLFVYLTVKKGERFLISVVSMLLALSLLLAKVRSAIAGIALCIVSMMVLDRKSVKSVLNRKVAVLSTAVMFVVYIYLLFPFTELISLHDRSAQARLPLNVIGFTIALQHPLGIGTVSEFNEFSADNYEIVSHMKGADAVRYIAPHNQFLNTLLYWGIPGFIMLMLFFCYMFRVLLRLLHSRNNFVWSVSLGIFSVTIAYVIASFFHNAGPFTGDIFYWYIVGLVPALVRISHRKPTADKQNESCD